MDQQQAILKAIETLGKSENEYAKAIKRQANAKYAYDIKVATGTLEAEGSEKIRVATGELAAAAELKEKLEADAEVKILKTLMDDCRSVISARQSILSSEVKSGMVGGNWSA